MQPVSVQICQSPFFAQCFMYILTVVLITLLLAPSIFYKQTHFNMEAGNAVLNKHVFVLLISIPKLFNRVSALMRLTDNMAEITSEDGYSPLGLQSPVIYQSLFVAHTEPEDISLGPLHTHSVYLNLKSKYIHCLWLNVCCDICIFSSLCVIP